MGTVAKPQRTMSTPSLMMTPKMTLARKKKQVILNISFFCILFTSLWIFNAFSIIFQINPSFLSDEEDAEEEDEEEEEEEGAVDSQVQIQQRSNSCNL